MPIDIVSVNFLDEDFNAIVTGVDYLNGSIGDKLTAEIVFDVHWEVTGLKLTVDTGVTKIIREDNGSFITDGFKVGDTATFDSATNPTTNFLITSVNPTAITYSGVLIAQASEASAVFGTTPIRSLDYYYGIIENNAANAAISLIDGTVQKYKNSGTLNHLSTTPDPLLPATSLNSWQYDVSEQNSTIEGSGAFVGINHQRFTIMHEFYIEPVFIASMLSSGNLGVLPQLLNINSLKYFIKIDARFNVSGSNVDKSTTNGNIDQFVKFGDVGGFDEVGNGATAGYTLDSIFYRNTLDSSVVTSILPNTDTDVTINLSSADSAFSTAGTDFIVNVYRTPTDTTTYQYTTTDIKENFLVSRIKLTTGGVGYPAEGFIKAGALVTYISGDEVSIDLTFSPTFFLSQDAVLNDLQAFNQNPASVSDGYLIFVTCQDKTITNKGLSDKVAVLCDVNNAAGVSAEDFYNTTDVCITNTLFNDHPTNDSTLAFTDYKGWLEDSVVTKSRIQVLKTNENQAINGNTIQNTWSLNNVILKIEAEHKIDITRFFILEESQVFYPAIPTTKTRNFVLPTASPQNEIVWAEDTGAETATHKFYDLQYPFKIRWEDWLSLSGVDSDFTVGTKDWIQYIDANWAIKVNLYKEMDIAQDLGLPTCTFNFTITKHRANITIVTNTFTATWTDPVYDLISTTNDLDLISGYNVERPLDMTIEDCTDVTEFKCINYTGLSGAIDFSVFTSLDKVQIYSQLITGLILPSSGGTEIRVHGNGLQTADLSGFTNLTTLKFSGNNGCTSVVLPTLASGSTLDSAWMSRNGFTTLDLTPILPAMFNGAYILLYDNALPVSEVNQVLIDVDATGYTGGWLNMTQTPAAAPTGAGATAKTNLLGKGWNVLSD